MIGFLRAVVARRVGRGFLVYAIPNAARRSFRLAAYLRAEGLLAGMPDVCLPLPRRGHAALFVELKRIGGEAPDAEQEAIHATLRAAGNDVVVSYGWRPAARHALAYCGLPFELLPPPPDPADAGRLVTVTGNH